MKKLILSGMLIALAGILYAQQGETFTTDGIAIRGVDVVSYFTEGKVTQGNSEFSHSWNGATWYFSSTENLEKFKADPQRYAPQYGGFCAFGTAEGHKAPTQPDAWTIVNGKLYLNYNKQVQHGWLKKQQQYIEQADKNWPTVKLE